MRIQTNSGSAVDALAKGIDDLEAVASHAHTTFLATAKAFRAANGLSPASFQSVQP